MEDKSRSQRSQRTPMNPGGHAGNDVASVQPDMMQSTSTLIRDISIQQAQAFQGKSQLPL